MNLFAISYYAPPQLTPQAIQIGRQLYHLDADVTLLHGRDTQFAGAYDQYPDFFSRIRPLPVWDPGPALSGLRHRAALRLLPLYGACPDLFGPWRRRALGPALACIRAARPDLIASFGMPMSDHLLAFEIKRRTGVPWLAHFSDPWAGNPFHQTSRLERRVNAAMERRVIEQADALLFTSRRTLEQVMANYPPGWQDKAAVLPHAWDMGNFDRPLEPPPPPAANGRKVVRHIGACYGARSPLPLFKALERIQARQPGALDKVRFEFVGYVSPSLLECAALKALPEALVSLRGQLGYRASLQLARDSDALLVIDAPSVSDSVFLPSKLVEYIGAGRPVWGITPAGTAADLIAEWAGSRALLADPADSGAIERMLLAGLASLVAAPPHAGAAEVRQRFAAARVAQALKLHAARAIASSAARATTAAFNANETALRR